MSKIFNEKFDNGVNSLEVTAYKDRFINFEIDNPWYGSTEQGFGATLQISIPWDDIKPMLEKLKIYMETNK